MLDEVADRAALVASRPATPMFNAPYRLMILSFREECGLRPRPRVGLAPLLRAGVGFKTPKSVADRRDVARADFHVSDDQLGCAARHVDLADSAGACHRSGDGIAR